MASFSAQVEEQARGPEAEAAVRRERDFVELAWLRGDFPPEATAFFDTVTVQEGGVPQCRRLRPGRRSHRRIGGLRGAGGCDRGAGQRRGGAGEVARRAVALYGLVGEAADAELADEVLSRLAVGPNSDVPRSPGGRERVGARTQTTTKTVWAASQPAVIQPSAPPGCRNDTYATPAATATRTDTKPSSGNTQPREAGGRSARAASTAASISTATPSTAWARWVHWLSSTRPASAASTSGKRRPDPCEHGDQQQRHRHPTCRVSFCCHRHAPSLHRDVTSQARGAPDVSAADHEESPRVHGLRSSWDARCRSAGSPTAAVL